MPFFSRRRLQHMLDALEQHFPPSKRRDLLARLNQKRTKDAIAAEMELGILWAVQETAHLEVEPASPNNKAIADALSKDLFGERPTVIEITTLSDDFIGGDTAMRRVSTQLAQYANSVVQKADQHLYFVFEEESGYVHGEYTRRRLANPSYVPTSEHKSALRQWLRHGVPPTPPSIRLIDDGLDVTVVWKDYVHPQFNFFCTLPAVTYSLENNTVFKALKKKERQLKAYPDEQYRCIFVADGGCSLIRGIGSMPIGDREVRGESIIEHFLRRSPVDIVCTISPTRRGRLIDATEEMCWTIQPFGSPEIDCSRLERMNAALPAPRFEGYQARSLHLQKAFEPQSRGWYNGSSATFDGETMMIKISARALQELLAGKMSYQQFETRTGFEDIVRIQLESGNTIRDISFESSGIDTDDDQVVIVFGKDPSASTLEISGSSD